MKPVEEKCYSLMSTLLIKAHIHRLNINKDERTFATYALKEVKELSRKGSISSDAKNYFLKHINPQQKGFAVRWNRFYEIADQTRMMSQHLDGKSDLERLKFAMNRIGECGFVCIHNAETDVEISGDNAQKMDDFGCFLTTKAIMDKAIDGNFSGVFSVFYQAASMDKLTIIIDSCQLSGFGIVLDRHPYRLGEVVPLDLVSPRLIQ